MDIHRRFRRHSCCNLCRNYLLWNCTKFLPIRLPRLMSSYSICFISAFIISYIFVYFALRKAGVKSRYIGYSILLNTVLILYFGLMFTIITHLGSGFTFGFSSLGGAIGMLLGIFIFNKIYPDKKEIMTQIYVLSLGLLYSISKFGCHLAGCCYGRNINGKRFPIQLTEVIIFATLFLILCIIFSLKKNVAGIAIIIYSLAKFLLDYLRYYPNRHLFSTNQLVCVIFLFVGAFIYYKDSNTHKDKGNEAHYSQ